MAFSQGAYYVATGLWPIVHLGSFYAITGPKQDHWLVQTVGALVLAVGLGLLAGALRRRTEPPTLVLGVASALAFLSIEVTFYLHGILRWVYLADALLHAALLLAWWISWRAQVDTTPARPA